MISRRLRELPSFVGLIALMVVFVLLNGCDLVRPVDCPYEVDGKCFDLDEFEKNLNSNLSITSLGYSYAIYYKNSLKKWGHQGLARRPQDGGVFDINAISVDMNVASCAKSITCIAALQLLERNNISLDAYVVNYLPQWWEVGNNIRLITFRDLLTHKSGFRIPAENYSQIRAVIKSDINSSDHGKEQYQNLNFCIFRILIPILNGDFSITNQVSDASADQTTIEAFKSYLQANIFDELLVDFSCTNEHDVLYYNFNDPDAKGFDPGAECHNAGGGTLSLSSNDLAKVMSNAYLTDKLLSSKMRSAMFNDSNPLGCYFDEATSQTWGTHYHHNGGFDVGKKGADACWYIFANDVVCAVSTNSLGGLQKAGGFKDINVLIEKSFDDAWN